MLYYERPFVKISWNEEFQCVESEWLGFAFGPVYREAVDKGLELLEQKQGKRNLSDMRKASVIVEEDARWLLENFMPRAKAAGMQKIAVVPPASVVAQMQLDQLSKKGGRQRSEYLGIVTEYFPSLTEARRWLASDSKKRPNMPG